MQSLRDKLLKAGLVTEDAAKKAESPAPPPRRDAPARSEAPRTEPRARPPAEKPRFDSRRPASPPAFSIPRLPPLQGSKEAHRQAAKKQLELDRALRELVLANAVPTDVGATPFYFVTRKNKLRRLELTENQAKQLERGELAVVERPDPDKIEHALVPPAIAEQMLTLSARAVRFLNKAGAQVGFLSDAEINARASEADAPEPTTADAEPTAAPESAESSEQAAPPAAAEPETFITIKRSPTT